MTHPKTTVTIHDVAKATGVSVSTVSRVLNNKDDVAPATYEKVRRVIEELGYTSSLAAKSMRSRRTNVIGVVTHELRTSFNIQVVRGANRAIEQYGYDLMAYTGENKGGQALMVWEQNQVSRLNGSLTDGIVIAAPIAINFSTAYPLVAVDSHIQGTNFPAVIATNHTGALAVMEYLIGLGHTRIGFISGHPYLESATRRLQGYLDGLREADIPINPDLIQTADFSQEKGFSCAQKLLALAHPPTAIFAANDYMAMGVIEAAHKAGLCVPQDLSVVGFDNIPESAYLHPPLTTVDQFIEEMGYIATEMLIRLIQDETLETQLYTIPTRLVIRDSCRAI
jgi:LacI family transcriptional regulator